MLSFKIANLSVDENDKYLKFILSIGVGFSIANCVDRIFFDINYFTYNDIFMMILIYTTTYYKYLNER